MADDWPDLRPCTLVRSEGTNNTTPYSTASMVRVERLVVNRQAQYTLTHLIEAAEFGLEEDQRDCQDLGPGFGVIGLALAFPYRNDSSGPIGKISTVVRTAGVSARRWPIRPSRLDRRP